MGSDATPHINIHDALLLDSDPDSIRKYYQTWAATYDSDVIENYYGIQLIADLVQQHAQESTALSVIKAADLKIMDVGCGTGLLGKPLYAMGYRYIDGVDLSAEMLAKAEASGFFRRLFEGVDIHQSLPEELQSAYDVSVCVGVFTPGHVLPKALYQLIDMTRPGGLTVVSTRVPYYDTTDFQQVSDRIETDGVAVLRKSYMNAPYRDDGDAHYWVYERV